MPTLVERLEAVADKAGMAQDDWGKWWQERKNDWEDDGRFLFFVAGGDFIRTIVYNVVYFFHDYYVYIKPYTSYSVYSCYKFTYECGYQTPFIDFTKLGERCDHPTLTRLTPLRRKEDIVIRMTGCPNSCGRLGCG